MQKKKRSVERVHVTDLYDAVSSGSNSSRAETISREKIPPTSSVGDLRLQYPEGPDLGSFVIGFQDALDLPLAGWLLWRNFRLHRRRHGRR